jgi:LCP family protein required for cell wall assembly
VPSRSSSPAPYAALPPHLDPRGRHRGHGGGHPGGGLAAYRLLGRTLGVILSVGLLLLAGYYWYTFRTINNGVPRLKHLAVGAPPSGKNDIDGTDQNILLVGNDNRDNMTDAEVKELHVGRDGGSKATDTMMVLHVPADGSKATIISLPRDSYVSIPGHGQDRLNSAYLYGYNDASGTDSEKQTAGADLLITSITNLTGLTINHYIQVSLLGFYEISKAIGGVPINLCHNVDDTAAANRAAGLDGGSGFHMSKGKHTITGKTALEFVRQRHFLPNGDLDRVRRQQYFLTSAFRKVASVGILFKLNALGDAVKRNIVLDPGLNLITLAHQMENLSANNIVGKTIPTTPETINGNSVLAVNKDKVHAFVDKLINSTTPSPSSSSTSTSAAGGSKTSTTTSPSASASSTTNAIDSKCIN